MKRLVAIVVFVGVVSFGCVGSDPSSSAPSSQVLVGAGDIADCESLTGAESTAPLLAQIPGTVFADGDLVYPDGTPQEFTSCYEPTWGAYKSRTRPAVGNHEYNTSGAAGYFGYWGATAGDPGQGYYSYDLGSWHIIVLNSNCYYVSCALGSAQEQWLRADLAAHSAACTAAFWHHPRFTSDASISPDYEVAPFWQDLYAAGADIVINGHSHMYERFARQDPNGALDPVKGIKEFVVGTGGETLDQIGTIAANSEVQNNTTWGVLKLTLQSTSYVWEFVPAAGGTFQDSGSEPCH